MFENLKPNSELIGISEAAIRVSYENKLSDLDREIISLRNDFQNLEALFQSTRQTLEAEIENLHDELIKCQQLKTEN